MDSGTAYFLAKHRMADLHREAEHERLLRRLARREPTGAIDAVGFRARIGRLLGGFPPLRSGGPSTAGA